MQVPFFGDQPFWGDCCLRAGLMPKPVPIGKLSKKALVHAFDLTNRKCAERPRRFHRR